MVIAGMSVVRLNFSHGKHEEHTALFNLVRDISKEFDNRVSIICDIQGPKIRTVRRSHLPPSSVNGVVTEIAKRILLELLYLHFLQRA